MPKGYQIKTPNGVKFMPWEGAIPPSSADIDDFISGPPKEEPGLLDKASEIGGKIWNKGWEGLYRFETPEQREANERLKHPGLNDSVAGAKFRGFLGGVNEAIWDGASSMLTSPFGAASELASLGTASAIPAVAAASRLAMRGVGAGALAHGGSNVVQGAKDRDPMTMLSGAAEMAGGGLGLIHAGRRMPSAPPPVKAPPPSINRGLQLDPHTDFFVNDRGMATPNGSGGTVPRGLALPARGQSTVGLAENTFPGQPVQPRNPARFFAGPDGHIVANEPMTSANGGRFDPMVQAAYGNAPEVSPRGSSLDLGQYAEQRRQEAIPGMSSSDWSARSAGQIPPELIGNPVGEPKARPLEPGQRQMGFAPQSNASLGYPLNITPNRLRPETVKNVTDAVVPDRLKGVAQPPIDVVPESVTEVPKNPTNGEGTKPSRLSGILNDERGAIGDLKNDPKALQRKIRKTVPNAGKLSRINSENETGFQKALADLDERQAYGEVADYQEAVDNLKEMYGVIDTMSGASNRYVREVQEALDNGYVTLNPKSPAAKGMMESGYTIHGRLSNGDLVLEYPTGTVNPNAAKRKTSNYQPPEPNPNIFKDEPKKIESANPSRLGRVFTNETGAAGNQTVYLKNPDLDTIAKMEKRGYRVTGTDDKGRTTFIHEPPKAQPKATATPVETKPPVQGAKNSRTVPLGTRYEAIPTTATPEEAFTQWVRKGKASGVRGDIEGAKFSDLANDTSLMDAYESGGRDGKLVDVQGYHDKVREELVKIGILKPDQKVPNYLRHEYEQNPELVAEAARKYYARNPSIAKTRDFPSYLAAEKSGLTRKFKDIPSAIKAYESKVNRAVANKELYDYFDSTGAIAKKLDKNGKPYSTFSNDPKSWEFTGPNREKILKLLNDVSDKSDEVIRAPADLASLMKNIYLAGGIPGTKYNMHSINVAVRDMRNNGFATGLHRYLTDPTGRAGETYIKKNLHLIPELMDGGYVFGGMEGSGSEVNLFNRFANETSWHGKSAGVAGKAVDVAQKWVEDPLFKRALPALKLERTLDMVKQLEPTYGRKIAIQKASEINNEVFGSVENALRSQTKKDVARIVFLAPQWLESGLHLAAKNYKATWEVLAKGSKDPAAMIRAKNTGRGVALAAGIAGTKMLFNDMSVSDISKDKASDAMAIRLGKSGTQKRLVTPLGTSSEDIRLPIEAAVKIFQGNPMGFLQSMLYNKFNAGAKDWMDGLKGQDYAGNNLAGKDKFGREISAGRGVWNYINQFSQPIQLQIFQAIIKAINGDDKMLSLPTAEKIISQGAEFPIKYENEKKKVVRRGPPQPRRNRN